MELSDDELAGVVDLFGGLTPAELEDALSELAGRAGTDAPDVEAAVADARDAYALVAVETADAEEETLLVVGPAAFPELPEHAVDLPHILDVPERDVDRAAAGRAARDRLEREAADAVAAGDEERIERLLDVCYDADAWSPVSVEETRETLADALGG